MAEDFRTNGSKSEALYCKRLHSCTHGHNIDCADLAVALFIQPRTASAIFVHIMVPGGLI